MNTDRHWIIAEIARVSEAIKKTRSPYLRNDYGRYRKKLTRLLNAKEQAR